MVMLFLKSAEGSDGYSRPQARRKKRSFPLLSIVRMIDDEAMVIQTILCNEQVAGHVPPLSTRRRWEASGQLLA
jgi:hypothetical protein